MGILRPGLKNTILIKKKKNEKIVIRKLWHAPTTLPFFDQTLILLAELKYFITSTRFTIP